MRIKRWVRDRGENVKFVKASTFLSERFRAVFHGLFHWRHDDN